MDELNKVFQTISEDKNHSIQSHALTEFMEETAKHGYDGSASGFYIPKDRDEIFEIGSVINIDFVRDAIKGN